MPASTSPMTTVLYTAGQSAVAGLVAAASIALRVARNWLAKRSLAREFSELDDRMLRDIGLTRADIQSALTAPALVDPAARLKIVAVERRCAARASARERLYGAPIAGSCAASRSPQEAP